MTCNYENLTLIMHVRLRHFVIHELTLREPSANLFAHNTTLDIASCPESWAKQADDDAETFVALPPCLSSTHLELQIIITTSLTRPPTPDYLRMQVKVQCRTSRTTKFRRGFAYASAKAYRPWPCYYRLGKMVSGLRGGRTKDLLGS